MNDENIRADAAADQIMAAIRNGDPMPDMPDELWCEASVRCVETTKMPPELRAITDKMLDSWAKRSGVDRRK